MAKEVTQMECAQQVYELSNYFILLLTYYDLCVLPGTSPSRFTL